MMPRSVECEIRIGSQWKRETVAEVLERRNRGEHLRDRLRCRKCQRPVSAHKASKVAGAHFEHYRGHNGRSLGDNRQQ